MYDTRRVKTAIQHHRAQPDSNLVVFANRPTHKIGHFILPLPVDHPPKKNLDPLAMYDILAKAMQRSVPFGYRDLQIPGSVRRCCFADGLVLAYGIDTPEYKAVGEYSQTSLMW